MLLRAVIMDQQPGKDDCADWNSDFDKHLSPTSTPRGPFGEVLQEKAKSRTFNECEDEHTIMGQRLGGDYGQHRSFEVNVDEPGADTIVPRRRDLRFER